QNEKLINYDVTHVISVDGYSRKIVTHITSAVKNNLFMTEFGGMIYILKCIHDFSVTLECDSRSAVLTYGLWDQLRIDCGTEFYLTIYIQANLWSIYGPPNIRPFCQTTSTQ
uniref:Uncharacterized protein n=1 Tax=Amphimedon queenslandica TaxID=400682 RepID=A0A1X7VF46_AMPQE